MVYFLGERHKLDHLDNNALSKEMCFCSGGPRVEGVIFSTLVPSSGSFQLPDLAVLGYGLGLRFLVVFTIIVSLTLTLTLITTLTVILP